MSASTLAGASAGSQSGGKIKYIVGGLAILAAIVYLIVSSSLQNGQYFLTVDELLSKAKGDSSLYSREIRISGAVVGSSITYDPADNLKLSFDIVNIPGDQAEIDRQGGLAAVLHQAVVDQSRNRIKVVYYGPKPDLLKDEAQAIVTGKLGPDGIFYANSGADGLLLKCPTRYEESVPNQAATEQK
jgi:cytochrome c-type biogenesis protein CcmE